MRITTALLVATVASPAAVRAADTVVTLEVAPTTQQYLGKLTFTATVTNPLGTSVRFWNEINDGLHPLAYVPFVDGVASVQLGASSFDVGTHGVYADNEGNTSNVVAFTVTKSPSTVEMRRPFNDPLAGEEFTMQAVPHAGFFEAGGTVTFYLDGAVEPLCVSDVFGIDAPADCFVEGGLPAGIHTFTADYSGTAHIAPSTGTVNQEVLADTLNASAVGLDVTTFYPVQDGYRDVVIAKGHRNEPISVTVKVYSPGGTLLKTASIPEGVEAYSYAWNGRRSDGSIYPEGKYKITQTLHDGGGNNVTFTNFVNLSKKKLVKSKTTLSQGPGGLDAKGKVHSGSVTVTGSYVRLDAPSAGFDWAGAGWEFKLPSADVYVPVKVRIQGRHRGTGAVTRLGAQNFSSCGYTTSHSWQESCFGGWTTIPSKTSTALDYYTSPSLSSSYRSGRKVRLMVSSFAGTTWVYKAQVVVTYGFLT